jgi:hypothetical protein
MKILTASMFALGLSCISLTVAFAADTPAAPASPPSCQDTYITASRSCSTDLNTCQKLCRPADPTCVRKCDATYTTCQAPNEAAHSKCASSK